RQLRELRQIRALRGVQLVLSGTGARAGDHDFPDDVHVGGGGSAARRRRRDARVPVPGTGDGAVLADRRDLRIIAAPGEVGRGSEDITVAVGVIGPQCVAAMTATFQVTANPAPGPRAVSCVLPTARPVSVPVRGSNVAMVESATLQRSGASGTGTFAAVSACASNFAVPVRGTSTSADSRGRTDSLSTT